MSNYISSKTALFIIAALVVLIVIVAAILFIVFRSEAIPTEISSQPESSQWRPYYTDRIRVRFGETTNVDVEGDHFVAQGTTPAESVDELNAVMRRYGVTMIELRHPLDVFTATLFVPEGTDLDAFCRALQALRLVDSASLFPLPAPPP